MLARACRHRPGVRCRAPLPGQELSPLEGPRRPRPAVGDDITVASARREAAGGIVERLLVGHGSVDSVARWPRGRGFGGVPAQSGPEAPPIDPIRASARAARRNVVMSVSSSYAPMPPGGGTGPGPRLAPSAVYNATVDSHGTAAITTRPTISATR